MEWQNDYNARDWVAVENWWRFSEDHEALSALLAQLCRDVPKRTLRNGTDELEEFATSKNAPLEWKGAAEILELGELEAKVNGDPASSQAIWEDQCRRLTVELRELVALPEVTQGDEKLSRKVHAERALAALGDVQSTIKFRVDLYEPDERDALFEFVSIVAIEALRAGYFAYAAESKTIQADARLGKKTRANVAEGGRARAANTRPRSSEIISKMRPLIEERKYSVLKAATKIYVGGSGSSADANRKIWNRHKQK